MSLSTAISHPNTTYLIPVGEEDVTRMNAMNQIFDRDSLGWVLPDKIFKDFQTIRMLDVGCGPGELTIALAKKLNGRGSIVAIDRSPEQIAIARKKAEEQGVANIEWVVRDAYDLRGFENQFNIVHCRFILSHLKKPEEVVKQMVSAVAAKGHLVMEELTGFCFKITPSQPLSIKAWKWLIKLEHIIQGSKLDTGARLPRLIDQLGMKHIEISQPNPIASTVGQKNVCPLSVEGMAPKVLPKFCQPIVKPWVNALKKIRDNPNFRLTFDIFIQVKAVKP